MRNDPGTQVLPLVVLAFDRMPSLVSTGLMGRCCTHILRRFGPRKQHWSRRHRHNPHLVRNPLLTEDCPWICCSLRTWPSSKKNSKKIGAHSNVNHLYKPGIKLCSIETCARSTQTSSDIPSSRSRPRIVLYFVKSYRVNCLYVYGATMALKATNNM